VIASAPEWQRLIVLAPVLIVGAGIVAGVLILLGRAFVDTWRDSPHKRLIIAGLIALCAVVVLLTYLGVSVPNEE
jgi:hypothetical protein